MMAEVAMRLDMDFIYENDEEVVVFLSLRMRESSNTTVFAPFNMRKKRYFLETLFWILECILQPKNNTIQVKILHTPLEINNYSSAHNPI